MKNLTIKLLILSLLAFAPTFSTAQKKPVAKLSANIIATPQTVIIAAPSDLQGAIDRASAGDTIVLQAGVVYPQIILRNKPGTSNDEIKIVSSRLSELTEGKLVTPADAAKMPVIVSTGQGEPAIKTELSAHGFALLGIEVRPADANAAIYDLIRFGSGDTDQNTIDKQAHHLRIDRCYIHGNSTQDLKRGVALNSSDSDITNSWFENFHVKGQDSQAIAGWNTTGNLRIINNHLEAGSYPFILGGAFAYIPNLVPTNIQFLRNYAGRPTTYRNQNWVVKNLFELKNARNVLIDGNVFENNWADGQSGSGILFTIRGENGTMPWATVEDVTFSNNIVRNSEGGINILGLDDQGASQTGKRIKIVNNLFSNINGQFVKIAQGQDFSFIHNTVFQTGNLVQWFGGQTTGFIFSNNIGRHNDYGFIGDSRGVGLDSINFYAPGAVITGNVITGGQARLLPPNNYFPATDAAVGFNADNSLSASSAYLLKGTDAKNPGADFDALRAAQNATVVPTPSPTPSPSPSVTPTPSANPAATPFPKGATTAQQFEWIRQILAALWEKTNK